MGFGSWLEQPATVRNTPPIANAQSVFGRFPLHCTRSAIHNPPSEKNRPTHLGRKASYSPLPGKTTRMPVASIDGAPTDAVSSTNCHPASRFHVIARSADRRPQARHESTRSVADGCHPHDQGRCAEQGSRVEKGPRRCGNEPHHDHYDQAAERIGRAVRKGPARRARREGTTRNLYHRNLPAQSSLR